MDYFWTHGVMSDEVYANVTEHCDFAGKACSGAWDAFDAGRIDAYNIYAPVCIDAPDGAYYPSGYVRNKFLVACPVKSETSDHLLNF